MANNQRRMTEDEWRAAGAGRGAQAQIHSLDAELPPKRWGGMLGDSLRRQLRSKAAVFSLLVIFILWRVPTVKKSGLPRASPLDAELPPARWGGILGDALRRLLRSKLAVFSLLIIAVFLVAAFFAPWLAPYDPTEMGWGNDNLPPVWVQGGLKAGNPDFLLGTDTVGRDILSRLIYGARTAMFIALLAAPLAAALGCVIGVTAGYFGGWTDGMLMSITDVFNAFPSIMFSVLLVFILRDTVFGNTWNGMPVLVLAFALIGWVGAARLVRAGVLSARQEVYVEAAQSVGVPSRRILFRHILPNLASLIIVWLTIAIPRVIILEMLLGYIGIRLTSAGGGGEFYVMSWGGMFFEGRATLRSNPTLLIAPSVCVVLVAVAFTFLGDRLRDAMDPRLRDIV